MQILLLIFLGHSNINTTLVYVYADDEHIRASYKQYSA